MGTNKYGALGDSFSKPRTMIQRKLSVPVFSVSVGLHYTCALCVGKLSKTITYKSFMFAFSFFENCKRWLGLHVGKSCQGTTRQRTRTTGSSEISESKCAWSVNIWSKYKILLFWYENWLDFLRLWTSSRRYFRCIFSLIFRHSSKGLNIKSMCTKSFSDISSGDSPQ